MHIGICFVFLQNFLFFKYLFPLLTQVSVFDCLRVLTPPPMITLCYFCYLSWYGSRQSLLWFTWVFTKMNPAFFYSVCIHIVIFAKITLWAISKKGASTKMCRETAGVQNGAFLRPSSQTPLYISMLENWTLGNKNASNKTQTVVSSKLPAIHHPPTAVFRAIGDRKNSAYAWTLKVWER